MLTLIEFESRNSLCASAGFLKLVCRIIHIVFPEFKQNHLSSYNNQSPYHIFREILACKECAFAVLNQKIDKILASISNDALLMSLQKQFETGKHSSRMRTGRFSGSGRGDLLNPAFPR